MSGVEGSDRWSAEALARRKKLEARKRLRDERDIARSWKRIFNGYHFVEAFLRLTGLYEPGRRTFMAPILVEREIALGSLPEAFDGLRVLHLSDTHFDLEPRLAEVAARMIAGVEYDVCLFTGDFRDRLTREGDVGVELVSKILAARGKPVFACLGNHDLSSDAALAESFGIRVLVNENATLERGGSRLYLCGVDDSGYFRTDDFDRAFAGVPSGAFSVVLAHDPGAYIAARQYGASLLLCGHTHAGQMCLPGGYAIATHSGCKRDMVHGLWSHDGLVGYTTSGFGGSRIPARYFSRGEIVIHTLRKACR